MSIKRYIVNGSYGMTPEDETYEHGQPLWVRNSDYNKIQSQLTALTSQLESVVAENSGLRHLLYKIGETGNANFGRTSLPTPATDAFLAEVRASAITEYANKRGFSFQHGSIHAHFGNGDVMVGSVTFENGDAGINFAPVREKIGGVGTDYEWTKGKTAEQVDSVFVIASGNSEGLEVIRDKLSDAISQLRQGGAA